MADIKAVLAKWEMLEQKVIALNDDLDIDKMGMALVETRAALAAAQKHIEALERENERLTIHAAALEAESAFANETELEDALASAVERIEVLEWENGTLKGNLPNRTLRHLMKEGLITQAPTLHQIAQEHVALREADGE